MHPYSCHTMHTLTQRQTQRQTKTHTQTEVCGCRQPFRGTRQHVEVRQSGWCQDLMTSPCFYGSPASARSPCSDSLATCSSSTRYAPAALDCCLKRLSIRSLKLLQVIVKTTRSCPAHQSDTPLLLQAAALGCSCYDH